ncbi:MAG: hypothetical protein B0W54_08050 [Cellvibrio sp. 79]|nr:MAG: hypothetical protein B0W54_08050 [Cellvibrio sp. 79]
MRNNNFSQNSRNNNDRNNGRNNSNIRWFNAHTEGCGYINGIREVTPKLGQNFEPFWASTFCLLEGNPENPTKKYINVTIVNQQVVETLLEFEQALVSGNVTVFAVVRLANLEEEPFIYGDNSQTPGALGINRSGRVISLIYLKVGDQVIEINQAPTTDFGVQDDQSRGQQHQRRPQGDQPQSHQNNQQGYQGRSNGNGNRSNRQPYQSNGNNGGYQQQGQRNQGKSQQRQHHSGAPR